MSIFKGKKDVRIKFSPIWTLVNFCVSSTQILAIGLLLREHLIMFPIGHHHIGLDLFLILDHNYVREFFAFIVSLHIFSGLLTTIFIFYDSMILLLGRRWVNALFKILSSPGPKPLAPKPKNPKPRGLGLTLKSHGPPPPPHPTYNF